MPDRFGLRIGTVMLVAPLGAGASAGLLEPTAAAIRPTTDRAMAYGWTNSAAMTPRTVIRIPAANRAPMRLPSGAGDGWGRGGLGAPVSSDRSLRESSL